MRQVAGGSEDHERRWMHREPLESFDQRVLELVLGSDSCHDPPGCIAKGFL
jgi:hypothetical protein